jgi:hypothetical protein
VKGRVKKKDPFSLLGVGMGGAGGPVSLMGANANLLPFAILGSKFGLSVTSGFRPGSITSSGNLSYHAMGRALDIGGGGGQMLAFAKAMAGLFGSRLKELIHTPLGFSIKDGRRVAPYAQADHYDHVHVAMQTGGMMVPGAGSGDKVHMQAMVEPGESVFVLNRNATSELQNLEALNRAVPRFQKGGNLLAGLDRVFPAHYLGQPGKQLSSDQVRAVAERWGGLSPARALQADQITIGESSRHPGIIGQDPGGTLGIGLWQITRGVQGALGKQWIDSRGGDTGMRNPRRNAEVMSLMSNRGASWSNWFGTRYLQPLQHNVQSVFGTAGAAGDGAKIRKRNGKLRSVFTKLRGVDMPEWLGPSMKTLRQRIGLFTKAAEVAGDMASRAEQLGTVVGGKDQTGWLNDQLSHLFALRNVLVDAESLVQARRDAYSKAIERAEKRLKRIQDEIEEAAKRRRKLVRELGVERKRPKPNRRKIRDLSRQVDLIDIRQGQRVAERKTLRGQIPDWKKSRSTLNTRRGDLLTTLDDVQGVGSPTVRLPVLPRVGVLGGQILDVQLQLRDAQQRITDSSNQVSDGPGDEVLRQLLRESNLRFLASQRQYQVFRDFDRTSGLQQFATGGIVQGRIGEPLPVIAHAGEGVFTREQMAAMGSPNVAVDVVINGDVVNVPAGKRPVEVRTRDIRGSNRAPLPGAGGGRF